MKNRLPHIFSCGLLLLWLAISSQSFAQVTTTYAVGTATSSSVPITAYYGYSYSEQIYLASDFDAAIQGQLNQITTIRFYLTSSDITNATNWTIYMSETSASSFVSNTDWITSNAMNQVFSGTVNPSGSGWVEIILDTPFNWDGTSNVVIGIDENQPGYSSGNRFWRRNNTGANRSIYYRSDSNNPDPSSPPSGTRVSYVPQIQFEHVPAPQCAGTPAATVLTSSSATACIGDDVDFTIDYADFSSGVDILWQYDDGSGWTDFPGSTSTNDFTANVTQNIDVRAVRTCTATGDFVNSNTLTITTFSAPTVVVDVTESAFCSGTSVTINASGADSYTWSPATGLDDPSLATVSANPTVNTTYTVTGTDINGCVNTATSVISPLSNVQMNATYTPGVNCTPGTPITIDTDVTPSTLASGSWEYRFLSEDGVTVLQDWNSTDLYNFVPADDSVYIVYYQARNTGCSDYLDSVFMAITIGFGADVTVMDYDCNNLGGSILLNNVFGQTATQTVYSDLLDGTNTADFTFSGDAAFNNSRAELTPSATSSVGEMDIVVPNFVTGINNAMSISFDITADTPINNYGTGGADGIAYSFGDDATPGGSGPANNGRGTKLRLSFDAADNGVNAAGIYLIYGYTGNSDVPVNDPATLAYSSNLSSWKLGTDVPVLMTIDEQSRVTVTVGGTVIFNNVELPSSYKSEDVSGWNHLFSARTGGDALRHAISNFAINAPVIEMATVLTGVTPSAGDFDISMSATGLQPGIYDVWLAQDETNTCSKIIGTYEIINTNPQVDLGNDTTICAGESLVLDAGNPGASYVWSGSNLTTQTITVSAPGTYVAYATAPNSCVGIGTINIDVLEDPTIDGVYSQGSYLSMALSAMNPQNVTTYDWDFGDNTTALNGPASLSHTYPSPGTYTVTLTVSNECGTETITATVEAVEEVVDLDENTMDGVSIYPNPTNNILTIATPEDMIVNANIYSATGALVESISGITGETHIRVQEWEQGIYFVQLQSEEKTIVTKVVVQ